ncbi:DUF6894 family protein [Phenylobacterium deserti]|uniref:DUF6894 domain-containing protein n=1 Tax=Phenylobacterium deserti TaxID=1914756 RepID=A0A328ATJ3_9CAUL|nr:hypothetical protein [Phenylobacterium deserti]RAK57006.1 hypothetical protein DJ018_03320 [Phenylobacterium deserti]
MARYFFHFGDTPRGVDVRGQELPDHNTARIEAVRLLGEVLRDKAGEFWDEQSMKLIITDEAGLMLFVLDVSAIEAPAVTRLRKGPRLID